MKGGGVDVETARRKAGPPPPPRRRSTTRRTTDEGGVYRLGRRSAQTSFRLLENVGLAAPSPLSPPSSMVTSPRRHSPIDHSGGIRPVMRCAWRHSPIDPRGGIRRVMRCAWRYSPIDPSGGIRPVLCCVWRYSPCEFAQGRGWFAWLAHAAFFCSNVAGGGGRAPHHGRLGPGRPCPLRPRSAGGCWKLARSGGCRTSHC